MSMERVVVRQDAQKHHSAGHCHSQPKHHASADTPTHRARYENSQPGSHSNLDQRSGDGDTPHSKQVFDVEMKTHTEHEHDDTQLGKLLRYLTLRYVPWRERSDRDPTEEIANDGRQLEPLRDEPEKDGSEEAARERIDEVEVLMHFDPT